MSTITTEATGTPGTATTGVASGTARERHTSADLHLLAAGIQTGLSSTACGAGSAVATAPASRRAAGTMGTRGARNTVGARCGSTIAPGLTSQAGAAVAPAGPRKALAARRPVLCRCACLALRGTGDIADGVQAGTGLRACHGQGGRDGLRGRNSLCAGRPGRCQTSDRQCSGQRGQAQGGQWRLIRGFLEKKTFVFE